jgi:HSP20 family molecular chaperone IbpA
MASTSTKDNLLSKRGINQNNLIPGQLNFTIEAIDEGVLLHVEVPGVDPESIEMEAYSDSIRIQCDRGELEYPVEASLDLSKIDVSVRWGMLEVVIPRRVSRPLKIKLNDK